MLREALVKADEQPYAVPGNWAWVKLGTASKINMGQSPKGSFVDDNPNNMPLIGGPKDMGEIYPSITRYTNKPTKISDVGDLIITIRATLGKTNFSDKKYCLGRGVASLTPHKIEVDYLKNYFSTIKDYLFEISTGTTFSQISKQDLVGLPLPLPPSPEQKRIVKKLSSMLGKLKEARELIREAKETFEERRAAILNKAFTGELTKKWRDENPGVESADKLVEMFIDIKKSQEKNGKKGDISTYKEIIIKEDEQPFGIPASWVFVRLGKVLQINPPTYKPEIDNDITCSFVPMKAVSDKLGIIENIETKPFGKVKNGYTSFKDNDVLFAKITPCMENGKAAIAKNLINGFGYGSTEFFVFRCSTIVDNNFLYFLVRSKFFRDLAKPNMTGTVGHRRVPKVYLHNYKFPLPPITEQKEIVRILDKLLEHENEAKALIDLEEQFDLLNKSILSKAFRGELGTNDPNDEPAIEILKRSLIEKMSVSQSR